MTVAISVTPVSTAMVLAMVDEAKAKKYESGVIGLRGRPDPALNGDLTHDGRTVRIRAAESALAAREVLAEHRDGDWLVVVTDREDEDLGAGIRAHFIWQRLRSPDPWEAVRRRFAATGIDPALTTGPQGRALATALLAAAPTEGWPAAPAGVLTRTHALGAVAASRLAFDTDTADVVGVLRWAMEEKSVVALADLRRDVGDLLADTTLDWIAQRAGAASAPIRALLARGELADVVPIGIVLRLLTSDLPGAEAVHQVQLAFVRLEPRWGDTPPLPVALNALGQATDTLLADLVHDRRADGDVERAIERADVILTQLQAGSIARHSRLLSSGLRARLVFLADALRRATRPEGAVAALPGVEAAWFDVMNHRRAGSAPERGPFAAAVRLVRWLAEPEVAGPAVGPSALLGRLARRYLDDGAWADTAINDAFVGVDNPELSPALQAVVAAAQSRRRDEERRFAAALAAAPTSDGDGVPSDDGTVWYLERVLPKVVLPLAQKQRVLLIVMDGMSAATATEILADVTTRLGWQEVALPGASEPKRAAALAVLPSLTEVSRASLLSGRLARGQQAFEQAGYTNLCSQVGKFTGALFHKKGVDTTAAGWSVSHDVGAALGSNDARLVTVVLNTIDDALDRSDPAGTEWTAAAVRHLEPLLARAAATGRVVVMTADHGHVVERRQGTQRAYPGISSARSRPASSDVETGEVAVSGPRVLTEDHRAVLAVDDTLRYGPLKAGYHGGASAAEVVVPVAVLAPEALAAPDAGLPPLFPSWWPDPAALPSEPVAPSTPKASRSASDTLFDFTPAEPAPPVKAKSVGRAVVASVVYKSQRKVAGRLNLTDDQITQMVDALVGANATRLPPSLAAQALGVAETRLRGAVTQVQQLLNVEGYAVLAVDAATGIVVLDVDLLTEQFQVRL